MSSTLSAPPERPRRKLARVPRFSKDPEVRSIQIGVIATLLFHFLLFFIMAMLLKNDYSAFHSRPKKPPETFNIDLANLEPEKPVKPPNKFVETNPDAPENVPDKTNNFGAQNQQAAQEKPLPDQHHDRPSVEGQKDIHSTQIVDGHLSKPNPPKESAPPVPETPPETAAAAKREQNPLSGFEKKQGEDADAFGSNIAKFAPHSEDVPEKVEGVKDAPLVQGATSNNIHIDPKKPMPRTALTRNVRPAIFEENKMGTSNIGLSAYDAKWSNYGQYLQKLIEAIQQRWENLIMESKHYPQQGTMVSVTFVLNSEGKIASIKKVEEATDALATNWCVSGISPSEGFSYGKWTDDMVAMLGTEQELTFTFYYQ